MSECWETATLKEPVEVLGFPEVHLELSCDRPCALVAARLCDVFPNGESSLITRGTLITHKGSHITLVKSAMLCEPKMLTNIMERRRSVSGFSFSIVKS